jgi:shikimate dehydrogenase
LTQRRIGVDLQLGLIGDNIQASSAPRLHRLAGQQFGLHVSYERLVPVQIGLDFAGVFERCRIGGYRGLNITYPYKEQAVAHVTLNDPFLKAMGAVNTVLFDAKGAAGYNTDYSGFVAAYKAVRGAAAPGDVLMIGAGGVGRAVAFGLAALGATGLRLVDRDSAKAEALAEALRQIAPDMAIRILPDAEQGAEGANGLINCTPVGMVGYGGTPLPRKAMKTAAWAFDAVYTPTDTQFLVDAAAEGLSVIPGWELFFHQGVHAWRLFSGKNLDEEALRSALLSGGNTA